MTCDWLVQTDAAPAPSRKLQRVECTVCHTKWISAWQIPRGSWLHSEVTNETDIFIRESSARAEQLLLLLFGGRLNILKPGGGKKSCSSHLRLQLRRRLMCAPPPPGPHPLLSPQMHICPKAFTDYMPPSDAEPSGLRQVFDQTLFRRPREIGLGQIRRGLLDERMEITV